MLRGRRRNLIRALLSSSLSLFEEGCPRNPRRHAGRSFCHTAPPPSPIVFFFFQVFHSTGHFLVPSSLLISLRQSVSLLIGLQHISNLLLLDDDEGCSRQLGVVPLLFARYREKVPRERDTLGLLCELLLVSSRIGHTAHPTDSIRLSALIVRPRVSFWPLHLTNGFNVLSVQLDLSVGIA